MFRLATIILALCLLSPPVAEAACPGGFAGLSPPISCATTAFEQATQTVTVSGQSSLDITGIPATSSLLLLACSLTPSVATGDALKLFAGTGSVPTWLVGGNSYEWSNYIRWTGNALNGVSASFDQATTDVGLVDQGEAQLISGNISNSLPVGIRIWVANYASSTDQNTITFEGSYWNGVFVGSNAGGRDKVDGTVHARVSGPITGLRLAFGAGTITGQCSVYRAIS